LDSDQARSSFLSDSDSSSHCLTQIWTRDMPDSDFTLDSRHAGLGLDSTSSIFIVCRESFVCYGGKLVTLLWWIGSD